jgi:glycosyltransferase involved in cell wall biosynthesis
VYQQEGSAMTVDERAIAMSSVNAKPHAPRPALHAPRVLMVTAHFFPHLGGVETHTYEVARRLARRDVRTSVLAIDASGQLPASETIEGVAVRRVPSWLKRGDYFFAPDIARTIARERPDVVHIQGIHTLVAPLAMVAAWRAGIPYVVTFHTGGNRSRLRNALRGAQWWAQRPLLAHAARLIGVSRFEVSSFRDGLRLPAEHFAVIRNGAQLPALPAELPAQGPGPLIVSVGRLERYKGHHRVIAALPHVQQHYPHARLLILGGGPYEGALRQLAADRGVADQVTIRSIPPEAREEMAATLAGADVLTLLSDYEAHPIAVMEALGLGCPVLVADTSGLRELAEDGLVRAVPVDSTPQQVAEALLGQLRAPLIPDITLPTWDDCADELLAVYRAVLGEARPERTPGTPPRRNRDGAVLAE